MRDLWQQALDWFSAHQILVVATGTLSLLTFVGTLLIVPILLSRMRADYFVGDQRPSAASMRLHPAVRWLARFAKNILGWFFVLMGVVMLVLPGQGVLTILIGIALLDFPGKRRLEKRIAMHGRIRRSIDWIRRRSGRPPLQFDGDARAEQPQPSVPAS
jgi:hypothetical protein